MGSENESMATWVVSLFLLWKDSGCRFMALADKYYLEDAAKIARKARHNLHIF